MVYYIFVKGWNNGKSQKLTSLEIKELTDKINVSKLREIIH